MTPPPGHARALALAVGGIVLLSPDALLIKLISADLWTVVFYRNLFLLLFVVGLIGVTRRAGAVRGLGLPGLVAGLLYAASTLCFVASIRHTTAANTLVVLGAIPMIAALMRWGLLGRREPPRTWFAAMVVMAALAGLGASGFAGDHLLGIGLAGGTALCMAGYLTLLAAKPSLDRAAALGVGALVALPIGAVLAPGLAVTAPDLGLLAILGSAVVGGSFVAFGIATRTLSGAEVGLVMLLEMALGPLFVWIGLGEVPDRATVAAGLVIAATVAVHSWLGLGRVRSRRSSSSS